MAARCRIGRSSSGRNLSGYFLELDLIRENFSRQVVDETVAAHELLGDVLHELREPALARAARKFLRVVVDSRRVRKPNSDPDHKGLRQKLEISLRAFVGTTEAIQTPQDERGVARAIEVLPKGGLNDRA